MRVLRGLLAAAGVTALGACDGATEITVKNLEGTWDASAYVYTSKDDTSQHVDIIVAFPKASFTLTVDADGTSAVLFDDGEGGSSSDSGQFKFSAEGGSLTLTGVLYQALLDGNRLTLTHGNGEYDFDDDGSKDPATVKITLRR